MTKQILNNETTTVNTIEAELLKQKNMLRIEYWKLHKSIGNTEYSCTREQMQDAISLGKIAESLELVIQAISALQAIPRK